MNHTPVSPNMQLHERENHCEFPVGTECITKHSNSVSMFIDKLIVAAGGERRFGAKCRTTARPTDLLHVWYSVEYDDGVRGLFHQLELDAATEDTVKKAREQGRNASKLYADIKAARDGGAGNPYHVGTIEWWAWWKGWKWWKGHT